MHAYSELPPRAVAKTATVLHHICNRFSEGVSLKAEQWTLCDSNLKFSLDTIQADLAPGCSCCFACSIGSDLTLKLEWDGGSSSSVHQLRLPSGGGLPVWEPINDKVRHTGLRELPRGSVLPQWILSTELLGPTTCDVLSGMPSVPETLMQAGCTQHASEWRKCAPCEVGRPCTVFACRDIDHLLSVASFTVPDVAIFLHNNDVAGQEVTADGGSLQYSGIGNSLKLIFRASDGRRLLSADLVGQQRLPIRTKERQRVVYILGKSGRTVD